MLPLILVGLLSAPLAQARPVGPADAGAAYDFIRTSVDVAADGSQRQVVEWQIEILRDTARSDYGTRKLFYREDVERLTVLDAATLNGADRVAVAAGHREDRLVASNRPGFDAYRQVLLSYPEVRVGSRLYLKYEMRAKTPPIDGFFSRHFLFSGVEPRREQQLTISSALPLFLETRDPGAKLTAKLEERDGRHRLTAVASAVIHEGVADEERPIVLDADRTGIVVASAVDYKPFAALAAAYDAATAAPLPPLFLQLAEEAAKGTEIVDKMDAVMAGLADRVRYMGDWRSVAGRFVPRGHATVAATGFGDCKDYATTTAALLRRLGFEADVALVERAADPEPLSRLPHLGHFNHAIVHARAGNRGWWLDPTNERSYARGLPEDIQGRSALVLRGSGAAVEQIPWGRALDSVSETDVSVAFQRDGRTQRIGWKKRLTGQWAWEWTGVERGQSKVSVERRLQRYLALPWELKEIRLAPFDLVSRIVRELEFSAEATVALSLGATSAGVGYGLPDDDTISAVRAVDAATRYSRFSLGVPGVLRRRLTVTAVKPVGSRMPRCRASFGGLTAVRRTRRVANGFRVSDEIETATRYLDPEAMRSPEFLTFQEKLRRCFARSAIILEPPRGWDRAMADDREVPRPR